MKEKLSLCLSTMEVYRGRTSNYTLTVYFGARWRCETIFMIFIPLEKLEVGQGGEEKKTPCTCLISSPGRLTRSESLC